MSKLSLSWFLRALEISCYTNHNWTCVSKIGINYYLLGNCLYNWYIWSYISIVLLWRFWIRAVDFEVHFIVPCYVPIVFNFIGTIAFLAFKPVNITCESSMFTFLAVFALENARVHIDTSNCDNVLTNVKASIN